MPKENLYQNLESGKIKIRGILKRRAPSHPDYQFKRNPHDTRFSLLIATQDSSLPKLVLAKDMLPPHMQLEYGFGQNATETDCYGTSIKFVRPNHQPDLMFDWEKVAEEFTLIPEEEVQTGDLWELHNQHQRVTGFDLESGREIIDHVNHCSVILTDELVCSKNGSGLLAGTWVSSKEEIFKLYESLRKTSGIESEYEVRFWRDQ